MKLKDILKGARIRTRDDISGIEIGFVTDDSRTVMKGCLFIAVRGYTVNGRGFIDSALKKGAAVVIAEEDFDAPKNVAKILVKDTRLAMPVIADNFYGRPSNKLKVIGITGTNGKTTITYLLESIIKASGGNSGVIGTISYRIKDKVIQAKNTTPGALELQGMLAEMVSGKLEYAVIEVSSHSLDQHRVDGVLFDAAIFTNITSDHLDYHKTRTRYFRSKARLFDKLKPGGTAVLNADDRKVASLKKSMKNKVVTYGIANDADIMAENIRLSMDRADFTVRAKGGSFDIKTRLIGMHNVSNILAAAAAAMMSGIPKTAIAKGVASLRFVPGRLETVEAGQPFKVLIDYAHTEDALYNVLSLLKGVAKKNIVTVFGCGGNRDRTKRPLMGKVACKFSDRVIITSDNPRYEKPVTIIGEIEAGIKGKFSNYHLVVDRREAIGKALESASEGDIVVIAGKGHENYQIIKDKVMPFDDREIAIGILKAKYADKRDTKDNRREALVG